MAENFVKEKPQNFFFILFEIGGFHSNAEVQLMLSTPS